MSDSIVDTVGAYLKQSYSRMILPEADGSFRGEILEFPGCIVTGDNPQETFAALEDAAASWLEAALESGQTIPDPVDNTAFSGRMVLRLPKSLHKKASRLAQRDGVSLNQFIVAGLAEHVGERTNTQRSGAISFVLNSQTTSNLIAFSEMTVIDIKGAITGGNTITSGNTASLITNCLTTASLMANVPWQNPLNTP